MTQKKRKSIASFAPNQKFKNTKQTLRSATRCKKTKLPKPNKPTLIKSFRRHVNCLFLCDSIIVFSHFNFTCKRKNRHQFEKI